MNNIANAKALTLTVVANMTSNYSESLGNVASIQKIYKNNKVYGIRSRESLKNAVMVQAGMYDDLMVELSGKVAQKKVNDEITIANCRALEGGYMNTDNKTKVRKSSIYFTDAISCENFINESRFHTNLFIANNFAERENKEIGKAGLLPYQYEYDKCRKIYSVTIDLTLLGNDKNCKVSADIEEKKERIKNILLAIKNLTLVVKGSLDNAEPIFVVGGLSEIKTHVFENLVNAENMRLDVTDTLSERVNSSKYFRVGILSDSQFDNYKEITDKLSPISIDEFFNKLIEDINEYYDNIQN